MGAGGDDGSNADAEARVVNQRYGKRSANVKQSAPCRTQVLGEAVGVVGGVPTLEVGQALHEASPPKRARVTSAPLKLMLRAGVPRFVDYGTSMTSPERRYWFARSGGGAAGVRTGAVRSGMLPMRVNRSNT
jgi:hypothetical protein